jgi:hypothetical protein
MYKILIVFAFITLRNHTIMFLVFKSYKNINFKEKFTRVKNSRSLHKTFNVEPLYLQHENTGTYFKLIFICMYIYLYVCIYIYMYVYI